MAVPDRVGEGPRLPDQPPPEDRAPGDPSVTTVDPAAFDRESRDTTWATQHEAEIAKRLETLADVGATLAAVECRSTQCRIAIRARDDGALMGAVGSKDGVDRLRGWADQIVLAAPTDAPGNERRESNRPSSAREMTIYIRFD